MTSADLKAICLFIYVVDVAWIFSPHCFSILESKGQSSLEPHFEFSYLWKQDTTSAFLGGVSSVTP